MLQSVFLNYNTLSQILLAKEEADGRSDVLGKIISISRLDLELIFTFLAKFKICISQLESDKTPTLWMVWPILTKLKKYLEITDEDSELIGAMKSVGKQYLTKNISDFEPKMLHKVSRIRSSLCIIFLLLQYIRA